MNTLEKLKDFVNYIMRIAYFDLGFSQEDYAITNTKKYGGGAVAARYLKQLNRFHLFAPEKAFENFDVNDRKENCFNLPHEAAERLHYGAPIDLMIPQIKNYDMIIHAGVHFSFARTNDLKVPIVHFCGFGGDAGHRLNNYILLYRQSFKAEHGEKAKYVKIGKPVPKEFQEFNNRDGIFQCTQHSEPFNTIRIAKQCIEHNIKGYFAGPIHNYNLMDYIDNKNTFYLGLISEEEKLLRTKNAVLYTLALNTNVPFNLSAIEANAFGTPILATRNGWFNEYIIEGKNGFFFDEDNLLKYYNQAKNINQKDCWESAKEFSAEEMTNSFIKAFTQIYYEWQY